MTWQFGRISDRHISWRLYGQTTFSTWCPRILLDGHSSVQRTSNDMFIIDWWLEERYEDDYSTHLNLDLDLWLEVGLSGGLNRSQVYGLSYTTTKNLWTARSVSTVGFLIIVSEHSNSWVRGDVRPTSTRSENPSYWKIWTTHCGLWRTLPSGNRDEITHGWSICSSLLSPRSQWRLTSSSSSSATSVLDSLFLNVQMFKFVINI